MYIKQAYNMYIMYKSYAVSYQVHQMHRKCRAGESSGTSYVRSVFRSSCFRCSSRLWGFEFLHAYMSWDKLWICYASTHPHNSMYFNLGSQTLSLKFCELKLREVHVGSLLVACCWFYDMTCITMSSCLCYLIDAVVLGSCVERGVLAPFVPVRLHLHGLGAACDHFCLEVHFYFSFFDSRSLPLELLLLRRWTGWSSRDFEWSDL